MNQPQRRAVAHAHAEGAPRQRIVEIPFTRPGVIPTSLDWSPDIIPGQTLTVIGFSAALTVLPLVGDEVNVWLRLNGDVVASCRFSGPVGYARMDAGGDSGFGGALQIIARKDRYSIGTYQFGTTAAGLSGSIECMV